MVLGIGCIAWALFSMQQVQSDYSATDTSDTYSTPSKTRDSNVSLELDSPIVMPISNNSLYPVYPVEGDNIGSLTIPAIKRKIPIIQGTGENELKKGVGHFTQSVLPGEKDNSVLSGHRDTVFSQIGNLKIGDQLIVQTSAGIFTYEVKGTKIVHEDDETVIVPTDHAVLTMTTCYPFYTLGNSPDRYIVFSDLVKSEYQN